MKLKMPASKRGRVQMLLIFGTFVGAWASILGRIAQQHGMPTPVIITFRMFLGALVLTPYIWQHHRAELRAMNKRHLLFVLIGGIWFGIHLLSGFEALKHTSILVSGVLGGTLPIWVALLEVYLLKAHFNRVIWVGLAITLLGGVIITIAGNGDTSLGDNPALGSVLALTAAVSGAIYAIVGRKVRDSISLIPYLWLVFMIGGLTSLLMVAVNGQTFVGYDSTAYFAIILLVLLPQLICHGIYNYSLRRLPATFVSVVGQLGIVISAVLAFLFFREVPNIWEIPGSIAIIFGITVVNLNKNPPPADPAPIAQDEPIATAFGGLSGIELEQLQFSEKVE